LLPHSIARIGLLLLTKSRPKPIQLFNKIRIALANRHVSDNSAQVLAQFWISDVPRQRLRKSSLLPFDYEPEKDGGKGL
jgi:hypothetical protein